MLRFVLDLMTYGTFLCVLSGLYIVSSSLQ
jgi:hypothetical protein